MLYFFIKIIYKIKQMILNKYKNLFIIKTESQEIKIEKSKFTNESFPQINLKSFNELIFNYSSNLSQKIFKSLQNEN